jgi:hypothetical protein
MILHISYFSVSRVATARRVLSPVSPTRPRRHGHSSRERRLRGGRGCPQRRHPLAAGFAGNTRELWEVNGGPGSIIGWVVPTRAPGFTGSGRRRALEAARSAPHKKRAAGAPPGDGLAITPEDKRAPPISGRRRVFSAPNRGPRRADCARWGGSRGLAARSLPGSPGAGRATQPMRCDQSSELGR